MCRVNIKRLIFIMAFFLVPFKTAIFAQWSAQSVVYQDEFTFASGMEWIMLLFWVLVLFILILVIRWIRTLSRTGPNDHIRFKTPMDILKERFVNKEIDTIEYESRKQAIQE